MTASFELLFVQPTKQRIHKKNTKYFFINIPYKINELKRLFYEFLMYKDFLILLNNFPAL